MAPPNDRKGDDNNDSRHLMVFYCEKMVGYTPSSFVDLVFDGERIKVGLKRGKFDHLGESNPLVLVKVQHLKTWER